MRKQLKKNLRAYSVLTVGIILMLIVGFSFVAKATDGEFSPYEVIKLILQNNQANCPVAQTTAEKLTGYSDRPGDIVLTKLIAMDDITTTGVDVTNPVTGDFYVENLIIETSDHTIASGTFFQIISSGDDYGTSTPLFKVGVSKMAKDSAWDLNTSIDSTLANVTLASSTQREVLEDGSKLIAQCTVADCKRTTSGAETGTGYVRITAVLKRAERYSNIYE